MIWPNNVPEYHNANIDACDMWVGPCACGAWHQEGEFEFKDGNLYRCGEKVEKHTFGNGRIIYE